jgi:RNA polymerase sigma factor (sigma-70 family)
VIASSRVSSDLELYRAWAAGDRTSGEALIETHLSTLTRFFANKSTPGAELEDLVAMTFERCAKGLGGFRGECSFRSYLLAIGLNVLRDELRRRRPEVVADEVSIADEGASPSRVVAARAEQRLLLAGLRSIPLPYQAVLELQLFEDLSREETAAVLGIPPGTVASRVRRARELLAEAIERLASTPAQSMATLQGLDTWAREIRDGLAASR